MIFGVPHRTHGTTSAPTGPARYTPHMLVELSIAAAFESVPREAGAR